MKMKYILFCILCHLSAYNLAEDVRLVLTRNSVRSQTTFKLGTAVNPQGNTLCVDSKGLLVNGKAVLPVMGEFHYSRVSCEDWKRELLKMKAGGVTIVSTYVFWIHHEELEGHFDWSGNKDLREFARVCQEIEMPLILRIGPFCHGEVLQGGIPTWVIEKADADAKYRLRSIAPGFIKLTEQFYKNIAWQVRGLLWIDGGPIIGVQLENESGGPWNYFQALKKIAVEAGFDVPIYTRTGWPKLKDRPIFGEILPLYGDYADGFWDRQLKDMPGDYPNAFVFKESRLSTVIANEIFGTNQSSQMEKTDLAYPYLTCELGGGMMTSYHRRINIFDRDALALAISKVGSGSNLPGYYMYHGGTNPTSTVTVDYAKEHNYEIPQTMGENQSSKRTNSNDMPIMSYDFQSPLGEMGQVNNSFHWTRRLHQMLCDWGEDLNGMDAVFPAENSEDGRKDEHLRWCLRTDGRSGFIFVNNYQRMKKMSDKHDIRFCLTLADGNNLTFPTKPITIKDEMSFVLPFGLEYEGFQIDYALAQPLTKLQGMKKVLYLAEIKGLPVQISVNGVIYRPKLNKPFQVKNSRGEEITICILDETASLAAYKIVTDEQDYMVVSPDAVVYQQSDIVSFESWDKNAIEWTVFPENGKLRSYKKELDKKAPMKVNAIKKREEKGLRVVKTGTKKVAEMPYEAAFEDAAVWELTGIKPTCNAKDLFLSISYKGDVARVYADDKLVADNFWNGKEMLVRVSDLIGKHVELKILPLGKEYPIYLQPEQRKILAKETDGILLELDNVKIIERKTANVIL